ncbi:AAA family ATPase [Halosquirtibacter xylanolyticus]|uniref:UvrD-helicase domain-containing protein n=1 Tax=Halosquirtibacter xylanolyticus TaxID=3374599 RepID=UPI003749E4B4|nr:AAA family ATPase [Prolixibacteraceae bacterium]
MSQAIKVNVNDEIFSCLDLNKPKSFFLFAGAGSGKTRSLVDVLKRFKESYAKQLQLNGQKVAIITYTNAASDEIKRRLEYDTTFIVSTIHSFAWELIQPFQVDIKEWIKNNTLTEIAELQEKERKGRGGKASEDRKKKIESKKKRIENLETVKKFTYNPNGVNTDRDSLNHAEVIKMVADFISGFPLMQKVVVQKYPILLIDESQDTKEALLDAFFSLQQTFSANFSLGLFGDTMQRIYTDGKVDLGENIPPEWAKPSKEINYRCPKRVIKLINKIRISVDKQQQKPADKNIEGVVRLFIVDSNGSIDQTKIETEVATKMAEISEDELWNSSDEIKTLTLEHKMAARRDDFIGLFKPFYDIDSTGALDGTLKGLGFFTQQLLPLINAKRDGDDFKVAQLIKKHSPILNREVLMASENQLEEIRKANNAVEVLASLWDETEPTLLDIIRQVEELNLLIIPEHLTVFSKSKGVIDITLPPFSEDEKILNWYEVLKCNIRELEAYNNYISDNSRFGTHQGVKGLEFERVMVILDDEEAGGFLFSYEKLLGAKALTDRDIKNAEDGKDTSLDRTRRLFYVTCSRAEKSLAIVAYTKNPDKVVKYAISQNWFVEDEIISMN